MHTAPVPEPPRRGLLEGLAARVRALRAGRGWSRRELAQRSGLSMRFLARVEAGEGNISLLRLEALGRALGMAVDELLRPAADPSRVIVLVGLRGAGKSTVGPLLARRLGAAFVEVDRLIGEASGLPIDQIFELHGEQYYRRLERDALRRVIATGQPSVVAAAGGVVNDPETWDLLSASTTVVWLRARPDQHWSRVIAQGDRRPMGDNPAAMEELRALLRAREPLYARARMTIDTSDSAPEELARAIAERLGAAPAGGRT